jgi:hypothetical protein
MAMLSRLPPTGSGRSFTAYVFTKIAPAAANFLSNAVGGAPAAALAAPHAAGVPLVQKQQRRQGCSTPVAARPGKSLAVLAAGSVEEVRLAAGGWRGLRGAPTH